MAGRATPALARGPGRFPGDVTIARRQFENWAGTIRARGLWTCVPRTPEELVRVVNWAHRAGWTVRPRGAMHGWSPFAITAATTRTDPVVLVDMRGLDGMRLVGPGRVEAGAGTSLLELLTFLQAHGLGLTSFPASGEPTVGGMVAIGAHGAALPAAGETPAPAHAYGSLSNLVRAFTAVVWDPRAREYRLRRFTRAHADAPAFLTSLGRALLVDVTLRAERERAVRCVSRVDIPAAELFAAPGSGGRTFASLVEQAGRVETIWFPFTESPWLKVWSLAADKPASARAVSEPYNYAFSDTIPEPVAELAGALAGNSGAFTPSFGRLQYEVVRAGLTATESADVWGASKDVGLYIRASTLRVDELGYAVLARRADIQRVLHLVATRWRDQVAAYAARGEYPINSPLELRCCSVDRPIRRGERLPALAATSPVAGHREWDTAIWVNVLTLPGTPGWPAFCHEFERWMLATFDGAWALARPEWSKGWAYTDAGAFRDRGVYRREFRARTKALRWAGQRLRAHDPHGVLTNPALDGLLDA